MKIEIAIENGYAGMLVDLLLREVGMLKDLLENAEYDVDRRDELLAEKAEIIKHLGQQIKAAPKKRGRPRGSKKGKTK